MYLRDVIGFDGVTPMPYALFSNDARLSKAYPTEFDVWKLARRSGLVVDLMSSDGEDMLRPVLDQDYEIRSCNCEAGEDPSRNQAEAEEEAQLEPEFADTDNGDKAA